MTAYHCDESAGVWAAVQVVGAVLITHERAGGAGDCAVVSGECGGRLCTAGGG